MRGLDTSVLVRYLTQDDPGQSRRANAVITDAVASGEQLAVNVIVLCELVWVLRAAYGIERDEIAAALDRLLDTPQVLVEDRDDVRRALTDYRRGSADFSDYLIGWRNRRLGCADTATFDRALRGGELFKVL